jgi:DnaK suppressor protein
LPEHGRLGRLREGKETVMANGDLDQEFVERQRERLEELRTELVRMVKGLEEDQQFRAEEEEDFTQHDSGDMSNSLFTRELDAGVEQVVERRLRNVERALQKIDEGTYGICDATGEPISRGRLEAVPEALYTLEAQQRQERLRGQRRQI